MSSLDVATMRVGWTARMEVKPLNGGKTTLNKRFKVKSVEYAADDDASEWRDSPPADHIDDDVALFIRIVAVAVDGTSKLVVVSKNGAIALVQYVPLPETDECSTYGANGSDFVDVDCESKRYDVTFFR